jgi:hypothetical protein
MSTGFPCKTAIDAYMRELYHPKDLQSGDKMSNEIHLHTRKPMRFPKNVPCANASDDFAHIHKCLNREVNKYSMHCAACPQSWLISGSGQLHAYVCLIV